MTVLKLSLATDRVTLTESGPESNQVREFSTISEVNRHLKTLGLLYWQLRDLWEGKAVSFPD